MASMCLLNVQARPISVAGSPALQHSYVLCCHWQVRLTLSTNAFLKVLLLRVNYSVTIFVHMIFGILSEGSL